MAGITIRWAFDEKKRRAATEACGAKSVHKLVLPVRGLLREKVRIYYCTIEDFYIYINNDRRIKALLSTNKITYDDISYIGKVLCMRWRCRRHTRSAKIDGAEA